uniref:ENAH actin regulator n=1 Tax=Tetraodon nigroviridis TaxID=99883 RepID=H3CP73_TETNG
SEQSICQARAAVMVYDDANRKWVPAGGSTGFSRVHIYHHTGNNAFRVVGRKIQDHQVVINCAIPKGLKYNQATLTFHQWRDARQAYGLNFGSKEDANVFASAMMHALEVLNSQDSGPSLTRQGLQVLNGPVQEDLELQRRYPQHLEVQKKLEQQDWERGRRSSNAEDRGRARMESLSEKELERLESRVQPASLLQKIKRLGKMRRTCEEKPPEEQDRGRNQLLQNQPVGWKRVRRRCSSFPVLVLLQPPGDAALPSARVLQVRSSSSLPPEVGPSFAPNKLEDVGPGTLPPSAPASPAPPPGAPPPPPPPPLPAGLFSPSEDRPASGLAAALAGAKLRKVPRQVDGSWLFLNSMVEASGVGVVGQWGVEGWRGGGRQRPLSGGGLMEEMSALLARRRRIAEKGSSPEPEQKSEESDISTTPKMSACSTPDLPRKPWERSNTMNGSKSPVISRPKSTPTPSASSSVNGMPMEAVDYERLKQDILDEMRKELSKLKEELIDAIREELARSSSS